MPVLCPLSPGPCSRLAAKCFFFCLSAGWWLLFTSSGTCINALLLNTSGFALFLFSLIRADDSCSPLFTMNGSRASLVPLTGNKILSHGCSSCACQASSVHLSYLFNKTLHDLWLHSIGLRNESVVALCSSQSQTSSPLLVLLYESSVSTLGKGIGKRHIFFLATVGAGNTWPGVKVYFP